MLNSVCKGLDYLFNSAKVAEAAQKEMVESRGKQLASVAAAVILFDNATKGLIDNAAKGRVALTLVDGRRRALFSKWYPSLPKAKRATKNSSAFVTARTLYVERIDQGEIVVKFSRKDQIVLCPDGTWYIKGDK